MEWNWGVFAAVCIAVAVGAYALFLIIHFVRKAKSGKPSCDCAGTGKKLVANYRKEKAKEESKGSCPNCCCDKD